MILRRDTLRFSRAASAALALCSAAAPEVAIAICFSELPPSAPAPEWVQLFPAGTVLTGEDGRTWKNSNPAALVADFNERGWRIPLDYEHATALKGKQGEPAPAAAWIDRLDLRDGEIWGRIERWTARGKAAVESSEYRYLSPGFHFDRNTGEILSLDHAALTNKPNFVLTALNRAGAPSRQEGKEPPAMNEILIALCTIFGIDPKSAAATHENIVGKVRELKDQVVALNAKISDQALALNRAETPDPMKFVPKAEFDRVQLALNTLQGETSAAAKAKLDADINGLVDAACREGKLAPSSRDWALGLCRKDGSLKPLQEFLATAPASVPASGLDGKTPGQDGGAKGLTASQLAICSQTGVSPEEYAKTLAAEKTAG